MPLTYLTRVESFSAAHRLHSASLSDEENARIFGKCNNPNGHGHNYKVEITIKGRPQPATGMLLNITQLKEIIKEYVLDELDHKNIDADVAYFRERRVTSTAENIAAFIWTSLQDRIAQEDGDVRLHAVKLHETDKNVVELKDEERVCCSSCGK